MKKTFLKPAIVLLVLFLAGCQPKNKEKLVGIWKLEVLDINNTALRGSSLGTWLWEFNEEGGYLVNVAGEVEKGTYKLDKDKLTLNPVTNAERPDQVFTIAKLDSATMHLVAVSDQNKTSLSFVKLKGEETAEKD